MDPFIGEIRIFTGNFAPTGWFLCQGQVLPISAYQALFAIIGTTYGGNGSSNFQLPNLQGRMPIGAGQSSFGTIYNLGQVGGSENITLTVSNMPAHTHVATFTPAANPTPPTANAALQAGSGYGSNVNPTGNYICNVTDSGGQNDPLFAPKASAGTLGNVAGLSVTLTGGAYGGSVALTPTGNGSPFNPISPYLGINYIIAYNGIFPSRG